MEPSHSGCFAIVVVEHPTEALSLLDGSIEQGRGGYGLQQSISEPLMIALGVVQVDILIPISSSREKCGTPGILGMASGYGSMRDL